MAIHSMTVRARVGVQKEDPMRTLQRTVALLIVPAIAWLGPACERTDTPTETPPPSAAFDLSNDNGDDNEDDGDDNGVTDQGVGTYTDPSVANQISNFSINRQMVSCGVGTVEVTPPGFSGPFAMLMYARDISHYRAQHRTKTIRASGRMRSITHVSGNLVEDADHAFLAIAKDNGATGDRFDIHFSTPFWSPGNPLCTPSTEVPGKCRLGGVLVTDNTRTNQMGDITVGR
jgi:hypothetical protein